jgi:hypothetical protein
MTGIVVASLGISGCKTDEDSSKVLEGEGKPDVTPPANDESAAFIAKLDTGCGTGNCHRAAGQGKLPFGVLQGFANQTTPIHSCLETKNCYADSLTKEAAQQCWTACIEGSGGLGGNGGIFQAAIRAGIVKKISDAAGLDESARDAMLVMPMSNPPPARDIALDIAAFRRMASWMQAEVGADYAGIRAIRPDDGGNAGQEVTCDEFHPKVLEQIIPDYSQDGLKMFGCPGNGFPDDPNKCFGNLALSDATDGGTPGLVVKILRRLEGREQSAFWMRSSADGRYASIGNGFIEDLKTDNRKIQVESDSIDPAFSPDNKLYIWPTMICPIAPLGKPSLAKVGPGVKESGCVAADVGVYGSMGTDINGDLLLISGYTNNNFGGGTRDSSQMPGEEGSFSIRRISNNRITEENNQYVTPFETDYQISPTGRILVGRLMRKGGQQAFRVRVVRPDGNAINPAETKTSGVICMKGEKANISFDNRFVTFHHYADGSPQDAGAAPGHSNIFVYDILKKRGIRVTNMKNESKAYFPHFRADGWVVFQIKGADGVESIATSNAALVLKAMP